MLQKALLHSSVTILLPKLMFAHFANLLETPEMNLLNYGSSFLQRLSSQPVTPSADLSWDAFLSGKLFAHATGEELSSL
jgi:hypothetical protein